MRVPGTPPSHFSNREDAHKTRTIEVGSRVARRTPRADRTVMKYYALVGEHYWPLHAIDQHPVKKNISRNSPGRAVFLVSCGWFVTDDVFPLLFSRGSVFACIHQTIRDLTLISMCWSWILARAPRLPCTRQRRLRSPKQWNSASRSDVHPSLVL